MKHKGQDEVQGTRGGAMDMVNGKGEVERTRLKVTGKGTRTREK